MERGRALSALRPMPRLLPDDVPGPRSSRGAGVLACPPATSAAARPRVGRRRERGRSDPLPERDRWRGIGGGVCTRHPPGVGHPRRAGGQLIVAALDLAADRAPLATLADYAWL